MSEREATVVLTAQTSQYNKELEKSQKSTDALSKSIDKIATSAEKINKATAKGLMRVGTAEIAGLTALSAVAATLEKQTSNIQANLALNKTSSGYNAVTASIRQMSREIPMARAEIAAMTTSVSGLGVTTAKEIGLVSKNFNRMGIATGEAPIGLATSMVQFQRAMGQNPTSYTMEPYQNATTLLSARAGAPAQDILSFAQSIAPASRVAGLSQSSVLGLSTAATRAGVDGTYASSTISQILNDITMLRYTKSPELGRFASALGMDTAALARPTSGPDDQDRFMRGIISQIINVSQSAEGPSRLSMLGYDGLRARKALQGLAQNPGGVEQYIQMAEAGMNSNAMDTGFQAATDGLADQMVMLRNRVTDVGQVMGEPFLRGFTRAAEVTNSFANIVQPGVEALSKIFGALGGPMGAGLIGAGLMYKGWSTMSKVNLASRGVNNIYSQALLEGFSGGQGLARGDITEATGLPVGYQRIMDDGTRLQRGLLKIGTGAGSLAPNMTRPTGVTQGLLQGVSRTAQFFGYGTLDWYEKGKIRDPQDRLDYKREQDRIRDDYRKAQENVREQNRRSAEMGWGYRIPEPEIPRDPRTGRPLVHEGPKGGKYTFRGVAADIARPLWEVPKESWKTAGTVAASIPGRIGYTGLDLIKAPVTVPFGRLQEGMTAAGGFAPWASQKASAVGGGLMAAGQNPLVQMAAITAVAGWAMNERQQYGQWKDKWDPTKGGGISDAELDNLSEYNERLGIATRSLTQFSKALDESNPAKSENINAELRDTGNVRDFGRSMDQLVNARLATVKTVEQAKEWIASQGTMNADQWVMVMRDFSKIFKNNTAAFEELNTWVQENQTNGRVPVENAPSGELTNRYIASTNEIAARPFNSNALNAASDITSGALNPIGWIRSLVSGGDPQGLRKNADFKASYEILTGSQASKAKTIGETKDASSLFGTDERLTQDQQGALTKAEGLSQVVSTVMTMADEIRKVPALDTGKINNQRIALDQYLKAAADTFGIPELANLDAKELSSRLEWKDNPEDTKAQISDVITKFVTEGAKSDEALQTILDSGVLDKVLSGDTVSSQLPDKTVLTSVQQALKGTAFENMPDYDKYFGENSNLGKMIAAYGTDYGDATDFAAASQTLLEASKTIDENAQADKQARARRGDTSAFYEAAGQSYNQRYRQYADLEQMKVGLPEGTKGFEVIKAAQAELMRQQQREYNLMNPAEYMASRADMAQTLIGQLNVDANKQSKDLQPQIDALKKEASDFQMDWESKVVDWGISRDREAEDYARNTSSGKFNMGSTYSEQEFDQLAYAEQDFYRSRLYAQEDFQRSMDRSRDAYRRNYEYSEAAFRRSLKYQEQDFYRNREREAKAHARQMQYAAEDMAKSIGDPYNRMQLQLLSDPQALLMNMQDRAQIAGTVNADIDKLKGMGLSEQAMQQLNVFDFNNGQQTHHLANTITAADVENFNRIAEQMVQQGKGLVAEDTGTKRSEKERDIALKQSLDDFLRNLKRTKFEHAVQVKFNKKEFEINIAQAEEDNKISLKRAEEAFNTTMERTASAREKALKRQVEDLFGMGKKGLGEFAKIDETIRGYIDKYGGKFKDDMEAAWTDAKNIIVTIDKAIAKLNKAREAANVQYDYSDPNWDIKAAKEEARRRRAQGGGGGVYQGSTSGARAANGLGRSLSRGTNEPGQCLAEVSEWYGDAPHGVPSASDAWSISKDKHRGDTSPPAGVPVFWGGGNGHVAMSIGGGNVRSTDWPKSGKVGNVSIKELTAAWNKPYYGWTGDTWGKKLKDGGIGVANPKGINVTIAEAGSNEMVVPLNDRGLDFMVAFQKRLVAELMGSTIPKSQPSVVNNVTNHTSNMTLQNVEVKTTDPKEFVRKLQLEQSKKKAALYKT